MRNNVEIFTIFLIYFILTIFYIFQINKYKIVYHLFTNPLWFFSFIIIILWNIYIFKFNAIGLIQEDSSRLQDMKNATFHGAIGFIIALFAHIDVTIPVFWLILLITYHIGIKDI